MENDTENEILISAQGRLKTLDGKLFAQGNGDGLLRLIREKSGAKQSPGRNFFRRLGMNLVARLDTEPELLFLLRGVDQNDLISGNLDALTDTGQAEIQVDNLSDMFGIDLETLNVPSPEPAVKKAKKTTEAKSTIKKKTAAKKTTVKKSAKTAVAKKSVA